MIARLRESALLPWAVIVLISLAYGVFAASMPWYGVNFTPYNGHFQNFWPLHRLHQGEAPFLDYPVYLGAGQLYLAYPLFLLLGSDFRAASIAHDFLSSLIFLLTTIVALRMPGIRWRTAIPLAIAMFATFLGMSGGANSALVIRSLAPFLAAALCWYAVGRERSHSAPGRDEGAIPLSRILLAGAAAGGLVLWSTDYGLPSAIAVITVVTIATRSVRLGLACLAAAAIGAIAAAAAVSLGHPLAWLHSAIIDPREMQQWYFNPSPANKVFSLGDLPWWDVALLATTFCAAVIAFRVFMGKTGPLGRRREAAILALLLASAGGFMLSCLAGTYNVRYAVPMWKTVLPTLLVVFGWGGIIVWRKILRDRIEPGPFAVVSSLSMAVTLWVLSMPFTGMSGGKALIQPNAGVEVAEMGGVYWPPISEAAELGRRLGRQWDAEGRPSDRRLHSLYSSVVSLTSRSTQAGPNYIIHALSDEDQARFAAPILTGSAAAVETLDHERISWGMWNVRMAWPIYRELFSRWTPTERTSWSVIWTQGAPGRNDLADLRCEVVSWDGHDRARVRITTDTPIAAPWWADVVMDVASEFAPSRQPLVGNASVLQIVEEGSRPHIGDEGVPGHLARFAWTQRLSSGPLSVPAVIRPGEQTVLSLRAFPQARSSVGVQSCRARMVRPTQETLIDTARPLPEPFMGGRRADLLGWDGQDGRRVVQIASYNPFPPTSLSIGDRLRFGDGSEEAVVVWRDFGLIAIQHADPNGDVESLFGWGPILIRPSPRSE